MKKYIKIFFKTIGILVLIFILFLIGIFGYIYNKYLKNLPPVEIIQEIEKSPDYVFYEDIPQKFIDIYI